MQLLATFDWRSCLLIVDLDGSLTSDDISEIYVCFVLFCLLLILISLQKLRSKKKGKSMYIATSYDQGSGWTQQQPRFEVQHFVLIYFSYLHLRQALNRAIALAQASYNILVDGTKLSNWKVCKLLILVIHTLTRLF